MFNRLIRDVLAYIEKEYPDSKKKMSPPILEKIFSELEISARELSPQQRHFIIRRLHDMAALSTSKKGLTAEEVRSFFRRLAHLYDEYAHRIESDSTVATLEKQLHELRSMVSTPADIDKRFRDLQSQLEALRDNIDGSHDALTEKNDDLLQKFLSSDKKAFIIMPFQRDFDNVWLGAIKPACTENHYAPLRVDEVSLSSLITEDIERYSSMAHVVIVDLTGNNPNVMFEFGWSLAKNKKPIVICQGDYVSKVAFDVRGIRHISYENSWLGIETLKKKLKEFIVSTDHHTPKSRSKTKKKGDSASTTKAT